MVRVISLVRVVRWSGGQGGQVVWVISLVRGVRWSGWSAWLG